MKNTSQEELELEEVLEVEGESKEEKFRRLANYRLAKVVSRVRQLRNLSNTNTYHFTDEQVDIIFSAIREEVDSAEADFRRKHEKPIPTL